MFSYSQYDSYDSNMDNYTVAIWFNSIGWLKGKSTGNHRFSHKIWEFPLILPLNQPIDQWFRVFKSINWTNCWESEIDFSKSDAQRLRNACATEVNSLAPTTEKFGPGCLGCVHRNLMFWDVNWDLSIYKEIMTIQCHLPSDDLRQL